MEEAEQALADFQAKLQDALTETRSLNEGQQVRAARRPPKPRGVLPHVETGVDRETLDRIYDCLSTVPEGFEPHPRLAKQFEARTKLYKESGELEWATGEALAFGSLLLEGTPIRFSGQDSRRGTFS